ncbi:MAG: DUF3089 domain-containing protein [bacterium]
MSVCCAGGCESSPQGGNPYAGHSSDVYQEVTHWLCHPDLNAPDDICRGNLDATIVWPDGSTELEVFHPADAPEVDCFYVYPTISFDAGGNSDLEANAEEIFITRSQAARYSQVCQVFAPVYRQTTIPALLFSDDDADRELAYADVVDAFKTYMAHHNQGRGYLLVGHSQGSAHLRQLIQEEIEGSPYLAERMVAAHLLGMTIEVPTGEDVGGTFTSTPLCRTASQTGCVITYASFRATEPPTAGTFFGFTEDPATVAGCTNPAALDGELALVDGYSPTELPVNLAPFISNPGPFADPTQHPAVGTPFFKLPGMVTAQCVERDDYRYLEVVVTADASDPRVDDIGGDFQEGWGLHLADISLALGNLVDLAQSQADAWLGFDR